MAENPHPAADVTLAVAIRRYFDVALYLLIFTGFGTLASTGRLDLPTVLLLTLALLFRGYVLARRRQVLLSERWTNLLTMACVGFYIADDFVISRAFLDATVRLVLFVMLVRLFSAQKDRDHYLLAVLAFLMVLSAAVLTVDSTFLLALAGFVLVGVATFILMEMAHSAQRSPVLARELGVHHAYRKLSFTVAGIAPVLLLLIFVGGGLIFFVLPRVSGAYLLKLRGVALNNFDGHNWSNTRDKFTLNRGPDGRFDLWSRNSPPVTGRTIHYRVTMEPFLSEVFFLLATPKSLQGNYLTVSEDTASDVFDLDAEHPVTRYEADSDFRKPDPARMHRASGSFPADVSNYLQLPALDPRVRSLAEQISGKAVGPHDKAEAIADYLRLHYGYTLQLPKSTPHDPIANFLFVRRQGHCEYFASSMAIMLRSIGIPSRIVNGFSGGEFNDITSEYVIRASDAHSWVEAYLPGEDWVEFDPTPSGNAEAHTTWSRWMQYLDAMQSFWREWIVNYD